MAARQAATEDPGAAGEGSGRSSERVRSLLRAAEKVFAGEGYHGATMRQLAEAAGVGVSLLVYHFETKQRLYYQVFAHRQYVNEHRRARLRAVTDLDRPEALDEIVAAFIDPVLALHEDPDDIWFARLVLREAADPSSQQRDVLSTLFDPMAGEFIDALRRVLPGKPEGFHEWAYLFSVGALTQSSFDVRIDNLTTAPSTRADKNAFLRSYITAALRYG
jgi:AcrR family transcriptional regulator